MHKYYLAIDLGASSGRHIIGYLENNELKLEEIYRFDTMCQESKDGLIWDLDTIYQHIIKGIKLSFNKYPKIESLAIDSWGVDYVLMNNKTPIKPFYAYRNSRTKEVIDKVHKIIPFAELYKISGIQFVEFNTIYQFFADKINNRMNIATDFLMIPEYFTYLLTDKKVHEYTNATTTGMVNLKTKKYDKDIISILGYKKELFTSLINPGTIIGELKDDVSKLVGGNLLVKICPSHDTASAFEALDVSNDSIIISSGTWSLVGVKNKDGNNSLESLKSNFTNEGGVNYIRYLKNINGMYLFNRYMEDSNLSREQLIKLAEESTYDVSFDVNDVSLTAPKHMKDAIIKLLDNNQLSEGDIVRSIFISLAKSYAFTINEIEHNLKEEFKNIYIVGGGAKNIFLNDLVKKYTNKNVIAMPLEATAIGNLKSQMKGVENYEKRN